MKKYALCHPDKYNYGKGFCRTCWDRNRKWKARGINITQKEYDELLIKQNGHCLFCNLPPKRDRQLDVDHDHQTGKIRGLLCSEHNRAIGVIEKNLHLMEKILEYFKN